ncbi:hypothetical protein Aeqsu_3186 [Aequorivita sublithincola DSM 14238]|uniref:Secreted protein n=1 Tax=Aequorivita sublithincola (strain DSM 14238 / LMG 21431 / ACAM 643 / 9-3) TaxID=746697 RepID=I3Z049_AEQSU|nr:hypothetical protein [Aequorivita sublithincola]AFL82617.1 hypothetical protein Aeqsu_3186 [Aequorivita sublithincola DSM 14238]
MKKLIHNSIAVIMAGVVLFTTMSFAVDFHYCGDTLVDFSFVQQADSCGMEKTPIVANCENSSVSEKPCCKDQQLIKQGQDDLKISFDQLSFQQQIFVTSLTFSYISLFEGTESTAIPFVAYPPPFIERDVKVLHQTFLI